MRKYFRVGLLTLLMLGLLSSCFAGEKKSEYVDYRYGFSFEPPELDFDSGKQTGQVAMVYYPPEDGFADNVNITIDPLKDTFEKYMEKTYSDIEKSDMKVDTKTPITKGDGFEEATYEFSGVMAGHQLRWIGKAVAARGRVMMITCTASEKTYQKRKPLFEKCMKSFKTLK